MYSMNKKHVMFFSFLILPMIFFIANVHSSDLKKIEQNFSIKSNEPLIFFLDADAGVIEVSSNKSEDQISVVASVNEKVDELDMGFDNRRNEFSISLDRKKWLKSLNDEKASRLTIKLPVNVHLEMTSTIKAGEINFDMAWLTIKNFELRNFAGDVRIDFPEPNTIEMESLDINVKVGSTTLRRLGNARFRDANINAGIGELHIDLSGQCLKTSEVDIDLDIGATTVFLPSNTGIRLKSSTFGFLTDTNMDSEFQKKGKYYFSNNYDSANKTMYVSINSGIGELKVKFR